MRSARSIIFRRWEARCGGRRKTAGLVWSLGRSAFFLFFFGAPPRGVSEALLDLAVGGAEMGHKALAPRWKTAHGVSLLWRMAQEGASNYVTRPKTKSERVGKLLLLDRPFLLKLAAAKFAVAVVFVEGPWSP